MRPYLAIVATFVGLSMILGPFVGWSAADALLFCATYYLPTATITVLAIVGALVWERLTGDRSLPARAGYRVAWARLRAGAFSPARWRGYAVVALTYPAVIGCFSAWRLWLNQHVPFTWDVRLAAWSAALLGGHPMWLYTRALTASPAMLVVTETAYNAGWAFVTHGVLTWQAFAAPSRDRSRALVAFALAWPLAGNIAAGLLMSAGPCYYGRVVGGADPFAPLLLALDGGSRVARPAQELLWALHQRGMGFPSAGVTAFPSMHVTVAAVTALVWWRGGHRVASVGLVAFTLAASVALGWHYALDGYAGILCAAVVWWLAGLLVPRAVGDSWRRLRRRSTRPSLDGSARRGRLTSQLVSRS